MKSQGSIEYLLILGAITLIVSVVVLFIWSVLDTPGDSSDVAADMAVCSMESLDLKGYDVKYDGELNSPLALEYHGKSYPSLESLPDKPAGADTLLCSIGERDGQAFEIWFDSASRTFYLENVIGGYYTYGKLVAVTVDLTGSSSVFPSDTCPAGIPGGEASFAISGSYSTVLTFTFVGDTSTISTMNLKLYKIAQGFGDSIVVTDGVTDLPYTAANGDNVWDVSAFKSSISGNQLHITLEQGGGEIYFCDKDSSEEPVLDVS